MRPRRGSLGNLDAARSAAREGLARVAVTLEKASEKQRSLAEDVYAIRDLRRLAGELGVQ